MKRKFIYFNLDDVKMKGEFNKVYEEAIASGKKFFMFSEHIYFLPASGGWEVTGLTKEDIVE